MQKISTDHFAPRPLRPKSISVFTGLNSEVPVFKVPGLKVGNGMERN